MGKNSLLADLQKINDQACIIADNSLGNVSEWISTGSLSLNSIISGNMFNGIPCGRITTLMGESGTGKSYIAARTAANAQKQGFEVIWFDSENATSAPFVENMGVNINTLNHLPITTLEDFRNQTYQILDMLEEKHVGEKYMIVLDSLGNLPTEKELRDAEEGHNASDMGLRAKIIKSMTRLITAKVAKLNIAVLLTNHTYQGKAPNPMMQAPEIPQGGRGVVYISSIIILLTKKILREDKTDKKRLSGNILKAITKKNRFVPEGQRAEIKLDFETGPNKYYGLLDQAEKFEFLKKDKTRYYVPHLDKKFFQTQLYVPEVWEEFLENLNEKIQTHNKFSSVSDDLLEGEVSTEPELIIEKGKK